MEILREVSKKHLLAIVTNLSWDPAAWLSSLDPARVCLHASYHPRFAGPVGKFADKILFLKEHGFDMLASVVAYPGHFDELADCVRTFSNRGVECMVKPYWGTYQGLDYPARYSGDQRHFLRETGDREVLDYEIGDITTLGKLCRTGQLSFAVSAHGVIRRCGSTDEKIGHVLDKDFELREEPSPCPLQKCRCAGFSVYLVENDGRRQQNPRFRTAGSPVSNASVPSD